MLGFKSTIINNKWNQQKTNEAMQTVHNEIPKEMFKLESRLSSLYTRKQGETVEM